MFCNRYFGTVKNECSPIYLVPFLLFIFLIISVIPTSASTGGSATFLWRQNPASENVTGYRLYYGANSRFDSRGRLKTNFSYDYYIDFADLTRCDADNDAMPCERLTAEDLQCTNLYQNTPKCKILNLDGCLYFTLTAYNSLDESNFTSELRKDMSAAPLQALSAISILLLK